MAICRPNEEKAITRLTTGNKRLTTEHEALFRPESRACTTYRYAPKAPVSPESRGHNELLISMQPHTRGTRRGGCLPPLCHIGCNAPVPLSCGSVTSSRYQAACHFPRLWAGLRRSLL